VARFWAFVGDLGKECKMAVRILLAVAVSCVATSCDAASGFFNMPTTLPQHMGMGFGPGYHAPMVLRPYHRAWNEGQGIVRARPHEYPAIYPRQAVRVMNYRPSVVEHEQAAPAPRPPHRQPLHHTPHPAPRSTPHTSGPTVDFDPPMLTIPESIDRQLPRPMPEPIPEEVPAELYAPQVDPELRSLRTPRQRGRFEDQ
jgi:hypothetical protein